MQLKNAGKAALLLAASLTLSQLAAHAQNAFLDQSFWKNNPDTAAIRTEIGRGSSPFEPNRMGFDAVVFAINANASPASIKYLLTQKGADVNKPTHDARTYIYWAASRGNAEIVQYLISRGAKVNMEDSHGMTPLGFAAGNGQANLAVYDALIKGGADIKQRNEEGATVLLMAVPQDTSLALTNYFISKGLLLQDADNAGNTAFNYAARTGNIGLMKTLVQKGVRYNDNAVLMASQGGRGFSNSVDVYRYLESLKLKPAAVNKNGENALHNIVRKPNQAAVIDYFLAKGVDVNQPDGEGNTPFMNASASNRDTAMIALLLPHVKNINQTNKKGVSALAMALRGNSAGVVQMLFNHGADVNMTDADGNNMAYYWIQSFNAGGGRGGFEGRGGERQASGRREEAGNEGRNGQGFREGSGMAGGGPRTDDFGTKMKLLQEKGLNLAAPQKDGSTLYHFAIAKGDLSLLKRIEPLHADVNAKNGEGLTPLHKAAMVAKDDSMLQYLLSVGADKNIISEFKETAFDLAKENEFLAKNNVSVDFLK